MRGLVVAVLLAGCSDPPVPTVVSLSTVEAVPFVAFADGPGGWTPVEGDGRYEYVVDGERWGVVWVCGDSAVAVLLTIEEAAELTAPCVAPPATAPLQGEVVGLADQESARVDLSVGGSSLELRVETPMFDVDAPVDGDMELALQILDPDAATTRVVLDRTLVGATTGLVYDAADAIALEADTATATGDVVGPVIFSTLVTRTGQLSWSGAGTFPGERALSLPEALLEPDDMQVVISMDPGFVDGDGRRVEVWRRQPGDVEVPFPDRPTPPTISTVSGAGGLQVRAATSELADAYQLYAFNRDLSQLPPRDRGQLVLVTRGWFGDSAVELGFPPVAGLPGWPAGFELDPATLEWRFSLRRAQGITRFLLPGHAPSASDGDGVVRSWADSRGFVE